MGQQQQCKDGKADRLDEAVEEIQALLQGWKQELDAELGVGQYSICVKNIGSVVVKKNGWIDSRLLHSFLMRNRIPLDSLRGQCQVIAETHLGAVLDEKIVQAKPKTSIIQSRLADLTLEDGVAELVDNGLRAAHQFYETKTSELECNVEVEIPTVEITFIMRKNQPFGLIISDNGTGMTTEVLDDYAAMGFSTYKRPSPEERALDKNYVSYSRPGFHHFIKPSIGRHGKGKISCFQLGNEVKVSSTQEGSMLEHTLLMEYSRLIKTEFEVVRRVGGLQEEHIGSHHTTLYIQKLNKDLKQCFTDEKKLRKLVVSLCEVYFFHIEGFPEVLKGRSEVKSTLQVASRLIFRDLPICIGNNEDGSTLVVERDPSRSSFHWKNTFAGQLLLQYEKVQGNPFERYLRLVQEEPGQEYGDPPDKIITKVLLIDFYFHTDELGQGQRPNLNQHESSNLHSNGSPYCLCYWNGRYMKEAKFPREFPKFLLGPRTNKVGEASVHAFNRHAVLMFFDEYSLPNDKKNKLAENQAMEKALFDESSPIEFFSPSRNRWLQVWKTSLQTEFRHYIADMNHMFDKEAHVKMDGMQTRQSEEGGLELVANEVSLDHLQQDLKPFNLVRIQGSQDIAYGWVVEILQVIETQEIRIKCLPVIGHRSSDCYMKKQQDGRISFEMQEMCQIVRVVSPHQIEHIFLGAEEEKTLKTLRRTFASSIHIKNLPANRSFPADDLPQAFTATFHNLQRSFIPDIQKPFFQGISLTLCKVGGNAESVSDVYQVSVFTPSKGDEYTFEGVDKWHKFINMQGCGEYAFRFIPTNVKYFPQHNVQSAEARFNLQIKPGIPATWEVKWKGVGSTLPKVSIDTRLPSVEIVAKNRMGCIIPPEEYPSSISFEFSRTTAAIANQASKKNLLHGKWVAMQQASGEFRLADEVLSNFVLSDINGEEICMKVCMGDYLSADLSIILIAGKPAKLVIDEVENFPKSLTFFQLLPDFTVRALDTAGNVCSAGVVRNQQLKYKLSVGLELVEDRRNGRVVPTLNGDGVYTFTHWFRTEEKRSRQGLLIQLQNFSNVQCVQLKFDIYPPLLRIRNLFQLHDFETGVASTPIQFDTEDFLAAYSSKGKGQKMTQEEMQNLGISYRVFTVQGGQEKMKLFLPDGTSFRTIKQLAQHVRSASQTSMTAVTLNEQDKLSNLVVEATYPSEVDPSCSVIDDYKNEIQMSLQVNKEEIVPFGHQIPFVSRIRGYKLWEMDLNKPDNIPIDSPYKEPICIRVNDVNNEDIYKEIFVWKSRRISSCIKIINETFVGVPIKIQWNDENWYAGRMRECIDAYDSSWSVEYEDEHAPVVHQLYSTEYTFQDLVTSQCGAIHYLEFEAWDQYEVRVEITDEFIQSCNLECFWAECREGVEMEVIQPLHKHPSKLGVGCASIRFLKPGEFTTSRKKQQAEIDVQVCLVHPSINCDACDWHFEVVPGPPAEFGLQLQDYMQNPVQIFCTERQSLLLPFKLTDHFGNLITDQGEVKLEHVSGSLCDYEDCCEVQQGKGSFLLQFCEYYNLVSDENMRIEPLVGMFKMFSPTWSHVNPISVEISLKPSSFVKQLVYINGDVFSNTEDSCCGSLAVDEQGVPNSWTVRSNDGQVRVELGLLTYDGQCMNRSASLSWEVRPEDVTSQGRQSKMMTTPVSTTQMTTPTSTTQSNITSTPGSNQGWICVHRKSIEGKKLTTSMVRVPCEKKEMQLQVVQMDLSLNELQPGSYNFRIVFDDNHDTVYFPHNQSCGCQLFVKAGYPTKLMLKIPLDVPKTIQSNQAVEAFDNPITLYCADSAGNASTEGFTNKTSLLVNFFLLKVDNSGNLMDFDHIKIAKQFKPFTQEMLIAPHELKKSLNFRGSGLYRLVVEVVQNNCSLQGSQVILWAGKVVDSQQEKGLRQELDKMDEQLQKAMRGISDSQQKLQATAEKLQEQYQILQQHEQRKQDLQVSIQQRQEKRVEKKTDETIVDLSQYREMVLPGVGNEKLKVLCTESVKNNLFVPFSKFIQARQYVTEDVRQAVLGPMAALCRVESADVDKALSLYIQGDLSTVICLSNQAVKSYLGYSDKYEQGKRIQAVNLMDNYVIASKWKRWGLDKDREHPQQPLLMSEEMEILQGAGVVTGENNQIAGFIGWAVNLVHLPMKLRNTMVSVPREMQSKKFPNEYGFRETMLYWAFGRLMVFQDYQSMQRCQDKLSQFLGTWQRSHHSIFDKWKGKLPFFPSISLDGKKKSRPGVTERAPSNQMPQTMFPLFTPEELARCETLDLRRKCKKKSDESDIINLNNELQDAHKSATKVQHLVKKLEKERDSFKRALDERMSEKNQLENNPRIKELRQKLLEMSAQSKLPLKKQARQQQQQEFYTPISNGAELMNDFSDEEHVQNGDNVGTHPTSPARSEIQGEQVSQKSLRSKRRLEPTPNSIKKRLRFKK